MHCNSADAARHDHSVGSQLLRCDAASLPSTSLLLTALCPFPPCSLGQGSLAADIDAPLQRLANYTPTEQQQRRQSQRRKLSREQLAALPIPELKARAAAAGLETSACAEKSDLVDLLLAAGGEATLAVAEGGSSQEAGGEPRARRAVKRCAHCGRQKGPEVWLKLCARCKGAHFCSSE